MATDREELKRKIKLSKAGEKPKPWKVIAGLLVIAVIIGLAWWLWPRGEAVPSEKVRFDYQMWFTYYGSEENVPLENLSLCWSAPKVDNSLVPESEFLEGMSTWLLYYIENDSSLTLQASEFENIILRGDRTFYPKMLAFGHQYDPEVGPVLTARPNRLYPREIFVRMGYGILDKEMAEKLTLKVYGLKVYGYECSIAWWNPIGHGQENRRIDFSFWVGLWRENVLVEQFEWRQENATCASYWLWPVT